MWSRKLQKNSGCRAPVIKIDMSWKKDLNRTIANIKPSDITIPNFTIPDSYFKNIKIGG